MNYEMIDRLSHEQVDQLYALYQSEWWTKDRLLPDIKIMLQHSDVIVGLCVPDTKELIGFTRVITDFVYKALILDVIVKQSYRGQQLGQTLMDFVFEHPLLKNVKHFELYCRPEMVPFYKRWGFTDNLGELCFMRKSRKELDDERAL